ncbi:hypothetical protein IFM89_037088 [Coptis chinensis]|uniref:Uncharacterized protein n=1 Tax=Coptis chinensis TaxID=261450 RepID=A0A835HS27_9MAGN|nr:hypothetical protein IFM89_037088 [Coptis chinensis]
MVPEKIIHHIVQELLGQYPKICPDEGNVETDLTTHPQLAQWLKFMVRDVLNLQADKWVPSRKEWRNSFDLEKRLLGCVRVQTASIRVLEIGRGCNWGLSRRFPNRLGLGYNAGNGGEEDAGMRGIDNIDNFARSFVCVQAPFANKPTAINSKLLT